MESSGLHANGYSLVRAVLASQDLRLDQHIDDFGRTLGQEVLEPTRIYAADVLVLLDGRRTSRAVHPLSHDTGGGLTANLARVIPACLAARVDRSPWQPSPRWEEH